MHGNKPRDRSRQSKRIAARAIPSRVQISQHSIGRALARSARLLTSHPEIRFLSFGTNKVGHVIAFEEDPGQHPGLNISPDGKWMIYARADYVNHDIKLVENFH
jgi:hypothetical protein